MEPQRLLTLIEAGASYCSWQLPGTGALCYTCIRPLLVAYVDGDGRLFCGPRCQAAYVAWCDEDEADYAEETEAEEN